MDTAPWSTTAWTLKKHKQDIWVSAYMCAHDGRYILLQLGTFLIVHNRKGTDDYLEFGFLHEKAFYVSFSKWLYRLYHGQSNWEPPGVIGLNTPRKGPAMLDMGDYVLVAGGRTEVLCKGYTCFKPG
jgi:hypothetical protein